MRFKNMTVPGAMPQKVFFSSLISVREKYPDMILFFATKKKPIIINKYGIHALKGTIPKKCFVKEVNKVKLQKTFAQKFKKQFHKTGWNFKNDIKLDIDIT